MERMTEEELKKELEKLKDFKLYVFEGDVYVKAEAYKEIAVENKKLREKNEEQYKIIESLYKNVKYFDHRLCDIDSKLISKQEENKKLKEDLSECECSFCFESDEVGFWKREYKRLKKWIKDHCKGYGNLFPEDEMKRQWKKADKKRK